MSLKLSKKQTHDSSSPEHVLTIHSRLLRLASKIWRRDQIYRVCGAWEILLILLVAAFLRFYRLDTTELDQDQAMLYRMAYDAVHHMLLPTTSNAASIGIANPPGVIYLFMP